MVDFIKMAIPVIALVLIVWNIYLLILIKKSNNKTDKEKAKGIRNKLMVISLLLIVFIITLPMLKINVNNNIVIILCLIGMIIDSYETHFYNKSWD